MKYIPLPPVPVILLLNLADICLSLEPGDPSLLLPPRGHVVQEELLNGTERPDQPLLALVLL